MLFPHKVGEVVEGTTFLAMSLKWDTGDVTVVMAKSVMSGYSVFEWEMSGRFDISVQNTTYHTNEEEAGYNYLQRAFNVSM